MKILKLRENLFLKENNVISYNTIVAHIENGKLIEHGRYSRTTSKHIHYVAQIMNLSVVHSTVSKKSTFYKYYTGEAKVEIPGSLTMRVSKEVASLIGEGFEFIEALAAIENIPRKDLDLIEKHLKNSGISNEQFSKLRRVNRISKMI